MARKTGLDGRQRDLNGQIREKNGATLIGTLRKTYGEDFAAGTRADKKLDNYLHDEGYRSLTQAVKDQK